LQTLEHVNRGQDVRLAAGIQQHLISQPHSKKEISVKTYLRYFFPASIIILALAGWAIATNLQSWSGTNGTVAAIDSNGGFDDNYALTIANSVNTPAVTSSGSVTLSAPATGTYFKQYLYAVTAFGSSAATTYSYPIAFTQTPLLVNTMSSGSIGTFTNGLTGGTIGTSGSSGTGYILVTGE
jgi:hypothetical protein